MEQCPWWETELHQYVGKPLVSFCTFLCQAVFLCIKIFDWKKSTASCMPCDWYDCYCYTTMDRFTIWTFGRCMCVAFCVDWILYQKARRGGDWDSTLVLPDYTVLGDFYFLGKRQDWCYASGLLSSLYCFGMWGHIVLLSCVKIYIEQDCVY